MVVASGFASGCDPTGRAVISMITYSNDLPQADLSYSLFIRH